MVANGYGESEEAEGIRELMDSDWFTMTEVERTSVRYLSQYFAQTLFGALAESYSAVPLRFLIDAVVDQNPIAALHYLPLGAYKNDWKASIAVGELMKYLTTPEVRGDILDQILKESPDGRILAYCTLSDFGHFQAKFPDDRFDVLARSVDQHRAESWVAEVVYSVFSQRSTGRFDFQDRWVSKCVDYFESTLVRTRTAAEGVLGLIPLYVLQRTPKTAEYAEVISRKYPWSDLRAEAWWSNVSEELDSGKPHVERVGPLITAVALNYARREL